MSWMSSACLNCFLCVSLGRGATAKETGEQWRLDKIGKTSLDRRQNTIATTVWNSICWLTPKFVVGNYVSHAHITCWLSKLISMMLTLALDCIRNSTWLSKLISMRLTLALECNRTSTNKQNTYVDDVIRWLPSLTPLIFRTALGCITISSSGKVMLLMFYLLLIPECMRQSLTVLLPITINSERITAIKTFCAIKIIGVEKYSKRVKLRSLDIET